MALNINTLFTESKQSLPKESADDQAIPLGSYDDQELLDLFERIRKESLDSRWVFERQWHRNILYILGRQWIEYYTREGGWRDKRIAKWIPRPVTNKCKETLQAIRAMFTSIKLGVNVRPSGSDPRNVSAAATADELAPILHEDHNMNAVMTEFDYWLIATGNAFLHTFVDYDMKYGTISDSIEQCLTCSAEVLSSKIAEAGNKCPECGGISFIDTGESESRPKGKPITIALSPLEMAFSNSYTTFDDLPYVIRMRWRTKTYFENHPKLKDMVDDIKWQKSPTDLSMQLFRSLSTHSDMGLSTGSLGYGAATNSNEDGITEYEIWYKQCNAYPDGLVFRIIGDYSPKILHLEETEAIPGPLPYKDANGNPLFTFAHAGYEHVGGRILASGPIDVIIQKQDQINQLDSMTLMTIQRVSSPYWSIPKGSEIDQFSAQPGWILRWNPLTVGGNAEPKLIEGKGPHQSYFAIREQYLRDIEELAGTFDIVKGAKPTGVEAFSALQLLVERSQSRFSGVFGSRGDAYKNWFKFAIELEREFGPNERTLSTLSPAHQWTFQNFKRAQLQGSFSIIVEDGSNVPKTSLGMRAAIQHASTLGMLNMQDPDQQYEGLKLFGLTKMVPTLDVHVQASLQKQQAFEDWAADPQAMDASRFQTQQEIVQFQQTAEQQIASMTLDPATQQTPLPQPPSILNATPLKWRPWYNPVIHRQEFLKWANSDRIRQLLTERPELEQLLVTHLQEIDMAGMQQMMAAAAPPPAQGAGMAMTNSNRESTSGIEPSGVGQGAQQQGPA